MIKFLFLLFLLFFSSCENETLSINDFNILRSTLIDDKIYDWNSALNVCPENYHLPDVEEWKYIWNSISSLKDKDKKYIDIEKNEYWSSLYVSKNTIKYPYSSISVKNKEMNKNFFGGEIGFEKKAKVICLEDNNESDESLKSDETFYGPFCLYASSPACINNRIYVEYHSKDLYKCQNQHFVKMNKKLHFVSETLKIKADSIIISLKHLPPCVYGFENKIFMTGNDLYLYKCSNNKWHGIGYSQKKSFEKGLLIDSLTNETYKTITIGKTEWMAQNLNRKIPGSVCYNNDNKNCKKYGRLYPTFKEDFCPSGWQLPSINDWYDLYAEVGYNSSFLRSSDDWFFDFKENNDIGFSIYPAGWSRKNQENSKIEFSDLGIISIWYSYDKFGSLYPIYFKGEKFRGSMYYTAESPMFYFYIRCIKKI
jgi:uncharacterized protein (TIGR02145 family)